MGFFAAFCSVLRRGAQNPCDRDDQRGIQKCRNAEFHSSTCDPLYEAAASCKLRYRISFSYLAILHCKSFEIPARHWRIDPSADSVIRQRANPSMSFGALFPANMAGTQFGTSQAERVVLWVLSYRWTDRPLTRPRANERRRCLHYSAVM
eukprot:scaffold34_cov260-Pinguiococcus_pyrenoidosus.AAC.30